MSEIKWNLPKNMYHPTRDKITRITESCRDRNCCDPDATVTCSKCNISERYQRLTGIRLETVEGVR